MVFFRTNINGFYFTTISLVVVVWYTLTANITTNYTKNALVITF